jgi:hypothetical protein
MLDLSTAPNFRFIAFGRDRGDLGFRFANSLENGEVALDFSADVEEGILWIFVPAGMELPTPEGFELVSVVAGDGETSAQSVYEFHKL